MAGSGEEYYRNTVTYETSWDEAGCAVMRTRHELCKKAELHDQLVPCPLKCGLEIRRVDVLGHQNTCDRRLVPCQNEGCDEMLPFNEREEHQLEHCAVAVRRGELAERGRSQLDLLDCSQGCGEVLARRHLQNHMDHLCERRMVQCRYDCGAMISAISQEEHETRHCEARHEHRAMAERARLRRGVHTMPWSAS